MVVETDHFTKRVEAKALANIRNVDVKKFVWKNIVTSFGVPWALVSNSGLHFDSRIFQEYCGSLESIGVRSLTV